MECFSILTGVSFVRINYSHCIKTNNHMIVFPNTFQYCSELKMYTFFLVSDLNSNRQENIRGFHMESK